jgi:hypothetical protein
VRWASARSRHDGIPTDVNTSENEKAEACSVLLCFFFPFFYPFVKLKESRFLQDITWEPDPLPLMTNQPPRVTASNTKIQLDREGALSQICPRGEDDLGWVQLQQKSLLWQEMIEGSLVVNHEGLTTMTQSSRTGWTVMSGTWNHLRKVWGPTQDTLARIQVSCKDQESLEEENVFSPTRHLLLTLKRL